jgi:HK97 gp10 family phage protein
MVGISNVSRISASKSPGGFGRDASREAARVSAELQRNFRAVARAAEVGMVSGLNAVGEEVVRDIKDSISDPYPPASAGGSPPHKRTGNLRDGYSAAAVQARDAMGQFTDATLEIRNTARSVGNGESYWDYVEFGTSRMEARPHIRPAMNRARGRMPATLARRIAAAQSAAARSLGGSG